ncbi:hypothetical protein, partial [Planktotalea sp.]|uniref:hypothetical protein n=1 Tax=Planktotalea sp. TaxID=2029877 RepID=UPI003297032D
LIQRRRQRYMARTEKITMLNHKSVPHSTNGPNRTFIPTSRAALQLHKSGHSLQVLDFSRV